MILVTGGAGFIGGNFLHYINEPVVCVDNLSYASDIEYIRPLINGKVIFEQADIADPDKIKNIFKKYNPNYIVNFAAESHVDNSIKDVNPFIHSNICGVVNLMQQLEHLTDLKKFVHVSTDEVYGSLELDSKDSFTEETPYQPNNPYSASKAASDHFVRAFQKTYGIPALITNCSNNYGPGQNSEKFIPTIITKAVYGEKIPVYGDGKNVRDWLFVEDHCRGIELAMRNGRIGEKYNIGGGTEVSNIDMVNYILNYLNMSPDMIQYVTDRPGHDRRYSISCDKIMSELDYKPSYNLTNGLKKTIDWYLNKLKVRK